jgi:hypothetical protein
MLPAYLSVPFCTFENLAVLHISEVYPFLTHQIDCSNDYSSFDINIERVFYPGASFKSINRPATTKNQMISFFESF